MVLPYSSIIFINIQLPPFLFWPEWLLGSITVRNSSETENKPCLQSSHMTYETLVTYVLTIVAEASWIIWAKDDVNRLKIAQIVGQVETHPGHYC